MQKAQKSARKGGAPVRLLFALELPPSMIETLTELQRRLLGIGIGGRAISQENFRMLFQVGGEDVYKRQAMRFSVFLAPSGCTP